MTFALTSGSLLFSTCFTFDWLVFLWEIYLSWRQYKVYRDTTVRPSEAFDLIDDESFSKSRSYKLDRSCYGFVVSGWSHFTANIVLLFGLMPLFWRIAGTSLKLLGVTDENEILQSLAFYVTTACISTVLDMPFKAYDTFVIEQKHGFNKQTSGFFFKDQLKKFVVSLVLTVPVLAGLIWIVKIGGDYFFIYVWAFLSVLTFFLLTIYPEFIAPLFDNYVQLPDGKLKTEIESLAHRLAFPLKKLYVVEDIDFISTLSLYNSTTRISLPCTDNSDSFTGLTSDATDKRKRGVKNEEIVAILGHELGHWSLNHTIKNLVISEPASLPLRRLGNVDRWCQKWMFRLFWMCFMTVYPRGVINLFLMFGLFALLYRWQLLYEAFGFSNEQPVLIGIVIIFQYVLAPYNELLTFLMTKFSRHNEFAADAFAASLDYADLLCSALVKLDRDNLSFPVNDWLFSAWHFSHPPTLERINVLKEYMRKKN